MIRNIHLVFIPISGTELLKALEFPNDESHKCVFCYVNEVNWKAAREGAGSQGNQS